MTVDVVLGIIVALLTWDVWRVHQYNKALHRAMLLGAEANMEMVAGLRQHRLETASDIKALADAMKAREVAL